MSRLPIGGNDRECFLYPVDVIQRLDSDMEPVDPDPVKPEPIEIPKDILQKIVDALRVLYELLKKIFKGR